MPAPELRKTQASFASGEISPLLEGRPDFQRYVTGLSVCADWIVLPQGGLTRRPPTEFCGQAYAASVFLPFQFSRADSYVIEIGHGKCRFWRDGALVLAGAGPAVYEVALPWTADQLAELRWASSANVIFIAHPDVALQKLERHDHDDWTIAPADLKNGPFRDVNVDQAKAIRASAATGAGIVLTATGFTFDPGQVGALWRLDEADKALPDKWVGNVAYAAGDKVRANEKVYAADNAANSGPNAPNHAEGSEGSGATYVTWAYVHSGYGIVKITAVAAGGATATAEVIETLPDDVVSAGTYKWAEGAFSALRGYPSLVKFHEQRMVLGPTRADFVTLYLSVSGDYENHLAGTDADLAMVWRLAGGETQRVNTPQWIASGKMLAIGTTGEEFYGRSGGNLAEAITPDNIRFLPSSSEGAAFIEPVRVNAATLYVAADTRRLMEWTYDFQIDDFVSNDLTAAAEHITAPGISRMAWQRSPRRIMWCVTETGALRGFTFFREHEVLGWHRHLDPGSGPGQALVDDVAAIPAPDGKFDDLYLIVSRGAVRLVERIRRGFDRAIHTDPADLVHLDSQLTYSGAPATVLTGFDHLEGATVDAVADGSHVAGLVVAGGAVTLPAAASAVTVGLPYTSHIRFLPTAAELKDGPTDGQERTVKGIKIRLYGTPGSVLVGDRDDYDAMERLELFGGGEDFDTAPAFARGIHDALVDDDWTAEDFLDLIVEGPFACQILSATKIVHVS